MNKQKFIQKLGDIEWEDFEVKEAKLEVPKNSWDTVSAFSNTAGENAPEEKEIKELIIKMVEIIKKFQK